MTARSEPISRTLMLWLAAVSAILLIISGLIFRSITQLQRSSEWVAHSYQVLDALENTQAFFLDAEAAERGYIATCRPSMITPFRHDLPQIYAKLATLRALAENHRTHRERVIQLSHTMTSELERMSLAVNATLQGGQARGQALLADPQNAAATRRVTFLLNDMEKEERDLLEKRLRDMDQSAWMTLATAGAGVASIFAILGFVFWIVRRETGRRERSETRLKLSNEKLEGSLQELHRYNASARAISLLGELLQTCRSTGEALSIAARHLKEMLPDTAIAIALINNSRDGVEVAQSIGDGGGFMPLFRSDDCWGLRRGRVHLSAPDKFEPACSHAHAPEAAVLCLPMMAQGDTLGVITFARTGLAFSRAATFDAVERQSMQAITEQLSLALANLKLQETLRNQSLHDPLTGLYNRRYMDEALAREINRAARQGSPLAVAMIDIDHFKRFNDTHGHEGGDALLAAFGRLLAGMARAEDIVCRYGGEEFAVILPGADMEAGLARLDEMRRETAAMSVDFQGKPSGRVTLSAGVAVCPRNGMTGATVLAAADAALYRAKKNGRDQVMRAEDVPLVQAAG